MRSSRAIVLDDASHTGLRAARLELDEALVALCSVEDGSLPMHVVEQALGAALLGVYRGLGASGDAQAFMTAVTEARACAAQALEALHQPETADPAWSACTEATERGLQELRTARFVAGTTPLVLPREQGVPEVLASVGLPRLLDPARPVLRPTLPLPAAEAPDEPLPSVSTQLPEAQPASMQQLRALMARAEQSAATADDAPPDPAQEPAPAPSPATPQAVEALRFGELQAQATVRFERARIALEELGMLAAMRRPDDDDAWTSNRECERRMLCRTDAIVAAGLEHLPALIKLLEDRPMADPELLLSLLFVLASLRGDDTRDQIARLLRVHDLDDPRIFVAAADALALTAHPGVWLLMREWLGAQRAAQRALAVEVLGRKQQLEAEALARACDDELAVQRAAARALCHAPVALDASLARRLMLHEDHEVAKYALRAAALRGDPRALAHALELTLAGRGAHADAVLVCALCGGPSALHAVEKDNSPQALAARGWYGHSASLGPLLAILSGDDAPAKIEAALALHRITGAVLTDAQPEPDLEDPSAAPFLPGYREPTRPSELSLNAEPWRKYVERHARKAKPEQRYRHGRVFVPEHDLWELRDARAVRCDRDAAYLELRVRFGVAAPLDTGAFVLQQHEQLRTVAAEVAGAPQRMAWHTGLER